MIGEDVVEKLKKEHPGVELLCAHQNVMGNDYDAVLRTPTSGEWARFMAQNRNDSQKNQAMSVLLSTCRMWPDPAAFQAMIEERPGLTETFGGQLTKAAGLNGEGELKKL